MKSWGCLDKTLADVSVLDLWVNLFIGLEAVHKVEQILEDLVKMSVYYQRIRAEHRQETEELLEALCIYAEATAEECKTKIDAYHATQMAKYTTKHLYEKQ